MLASSAEQPALLKLSPSQQSSLCFLLPALVCLPAAGCDTGYLLALAVAHGCTEVAELLLDPPPSLHTILTSQCLPPEPSSVLEGQQQGEGSRDASEDGSGGSSAGGSAESPSHQVLGLGLQECQVLGVEVAGVPRLAGQQSGAVREWGCPACFDRSCQ